MSEISMNEWMAQLEKLNATKLNQAEGFTTQELANAAGMTRAGAGVRIREAVHAGLIEFAGYASRPNITGMPRKTPVYRVVKGKKK